MLIDPSDITAIVEASAKPVDREAMMRQARDFLYNNQECFVAQWVLQNPYADISSYRLKFVYNDESLLGYTCEMEKIIDG